jgi:hypothetical protein
MRSAIVRYATIHCLTGCSTSTSSRLRASAAAEVRRSTCTSPPIMSGSGSDGTAAPLWPSS